MRENHAVLTPKQIEIADAALKIIGEKGIAALTTASLAQELNVSSGAPFRHFSSREEILCAVVSRVVDLVNAAYPPSSLPPLERLHALYLARVETVGKRLGVARLIFSDQFALALPACANEKMLDLVRETRLFVLQALEEAQRAGLIRTDIAAQALLPIFLGALQHLVFLSALPPGLGQAPSGESVFQTLSLLLKSPGAN